MGQIIIGLEELERKIGKEKLIQMVHKEGYKEYNEQKRIVQLIGAALRQIATDVKTDVYNDGNDVKTEKDRNGKQEGFTKTRFIVDTDRDREEIMIDLMKRLE